MADGLIAAKLDTYNDAGFAGLSATFFVSLHSGAPGGTGANELSGNGYARKQVTLSASSAGIKSNSAALVFGPATASWSIQYYGLWTAVSSGTFLGYWTIRDSGGTPLVSPATVAIAASAVFAIGELKFTVANA